MASRYTRDEIILQGLDLASSPTLSHHDAPGGIVESNAHAIQWLQNALDMFHRKYPFANDIQTIAMTIQAGSNDVLLALPLPPNANSVYLPPDFIIDVRRGLIVTNRGVSQRLEKKSFQYWLNISINNSNNPTILPSTYCIINNRIKVAPITTENQSALLYYYALPVVLEANDPVQFPDEFVLIEFVRLKALEWTRSIDPGTAQAYLQKQLAGLRSSGLLQEPEYEDGIPIENNQRIGDNVNAYDWMGPTIVR